MILKNVQALRALAVMAVVLGHLQPLAQQIHPALSWVGLGRAGVDLFFVISGFIMVYTTEREAPSAGQFALRRLIRIVPLYWLVTFGMFALTLVAPSLLGASRADPIWLAKSLAFIPFDKGDGSANPLVPVGWTLNYEMFFYSIFALSLLIQQRIARYLTVSAVVALLGLIGFGGTFGSIIINFYTRPILIEFALGILLGLLFNRLPSVHNTALVWLGTAALVGFVVAAGASGLAQTEAMRVTIAGASSTCIVGLCLMLERGGRAVRNPLVILIGDASYAIYLTHMFVTQAFIIGAHVVGATAPASAAALLLGALVMVVVSGVLTFRLYERPTGRLLKRLIMPSSALAVSTRSTATSSEVT